MPSNKPLAHGAPPEVIYKPPASSRGLFRGKKATKKPRTKLVRGHISENRSEDRFLPLSARRNLRTEVAVECFRKMAARESGLSFEDVDQLTRIEFRPVYRQEIHECCYDKELFMSVAATKIGKSLSSISGIDLPSYHKMVESPKSPIH